MLKVTVISPVFRAVLVVGAVMAIATGVTFAALQSQATLTDSTINTPTASLKLWDGDSFESTAPGFVVTGLVPGTGTADLPFYFKNDGGLPLNITARVPVAPSLSGFSGLSNVMVTFKSEFAGSPVVTNLQNLLDGEVALPGNPLAAGAQGNSGVPGTEGNYSAKFDINPAAVSGSSASVGNFNVIFAGTQP